MLFSQVLSTLRLRKELSMKSCNSAFISRVFILLSSLLLLRLINFSYAYSFVTTLVSYTYKPAGVANKSLLTILNSTLEVGSIKVASFSTFAIEVKNSNSAFIGNGLDVFVGLPRSFGFIDSEGNVKLTDIRITPFPAVVSVYFVLCRGSYDASTQPFPNVGFDHCELVNLDLIEIESGTVLSSGFHREERISQCVLTNISITPSRWRENKNVGVRRVGLTERCTMDGVIEMDARVRELNVQEKRE